MWISQGKAYGAQHARQGSDGGEARGGGDPLTGCISRTRPLVCFAGVRSKKKRGRYSLFVSGLCLRSGEARRDAHKRAPPRANSLFARILGAPWRLNLSIADDVTSSVAAPLQTDKNLHVLDAA